ncbi:MAG TPA: pilus assembly protein, partial [Rhizomicrobium sp.]
MRKSIQQLAAIVRSFSGSSRGNVAMMFALALIPMVLGAAAGLDFARAMLVRQQMSEALDAAALAVGSSKGLDQASALALAQKYFNANFTVDTGDYGQPTVSIPSGGYNSSGSVQLAANDTMPTVLMRVAGINTLPISTTSTVVWGQTKLWVALVLDNTGSMGQSDSTGTTKISALQTASHQLLTILQNAASTPGDVQVSIVPFSKLVKVGTGYVGASWIDWTDWQAAPPNPSSSPSGIPATTGPGDSCPWNTSNDGFTCVRSPTSTSTTSTIPTSSPNTGLICPSAIKTYTSSGSLAGK